ncbi:MAG: antibiotic biosynthesis monooxygenase family protein, partial [Planctomycetota bacterium]
MIHVIATIELAPGTRETYLTAFRKIISDVRAEKGCIEYGP